MKYSIEPRYRTFVNDNGILSFARNIVKNPTIKYDQKVFDSMKNQQQVLLKML